MGSRSQVWQKARRNATFLEPKLLLKRKSSEREEMRVSHPWSSPSWYHCRLSWSIRSSIILKVRSFSGLVVIATEIQNERVQSSSPCIGLPESLVCGWVDAGLAAPAASFPMAVVLLEREVSPVLLAVSPKPTKLAFPSSLIPALLIPSS